MSVTSDIARQMEYPIIRGRSMALAVSIMAEQIDHDPRLAEVLDGLGSVIYEIMDQLEQDVEKIIAVEAT